MHEIDKQVIDLEKKLRGAGIQVRITGKSGRFGDLSPTMHIGFEGDPDVFHITLRRVTSDKENEERLGLV